MDCNAKGCVIRWARALNVQVWTLRRSDTARKSALDFELRRNFNIAALTRPLCARSDAFAATWIFRFACPFECSVLFAAPAVVTHLVFSYGRA